MISEKNGAQGPVPQIQLGLLHVEKQVEHDGIEMGVLENGIPYLSESGLARMCGIDRKVLNRLAINWDKEKDKPRGAQILKLLEQSGYAENTLYIKSEHNGREINAYIEPVCLAILEFYAFISDETRVDAIKAFRALARVTFRDFIYRAVGYSPEQKLLDSWKHFHDRIDMTEGVVPIGYFGVFREISEMIVPMIRAGLTISDRVVPDISVGKAWSAWWVENGYDEKYGGRIKYDHDYPEYYPQAKSNPQPSYAYPDAALGEFRAWLRERYITEKFPAYLLNQARSGKLPRLTVERVIETFVVKSIDDIGEKKVKRALPKSK